MLPLNKEVMKDTAFPFLFINFQKTILTQKLNIKKSKDIPVTGHEGP
jgi:hypothetical protein